MTSSTSPKSSLAKLGLYTSRPKSLKVVILGQGGVGKSAMVVRFITKRFIGEYDPTLEKMYSFHTLIDNEMVYFDILDTAAQPHESECPTLEANIRWAEAFILMYSVTDKCSFDECNRLKFLINYNKRRKRLGGGVKEGPLDLPVVLVGNKTDQSSDRMISHEEGQRRSKEIGCVCFHEISVRESIEQVWSVFSDLCRFWRVHNKCPVKFRRAKSERDSVSPDTIRMLCAAVISPSVFDSGDSPPSSVNKMPLRNRQNAEGVLDKDDEFKDDCSPSLERAPFRERASTDGHLELRPWMWRHHRQPSSEPAPLKQEMYFLKADRRMSISMRGNNASY